MNPENEQFSAICRFSKESIHENSDIQLRNRNDVKS